MLVYSENPEVRAQLLSGGRQLAARLGLTLSAVLLNPDDEDEQTQQCGQYGAQRIWLAHSENLVLWDVQTVAEALVQIAGAASPTVILIGSTRRGKELAGRVAQKLEAGCVTDAIALEVEDDRLVAQRCSLGGRTIATQQITTPVKVLAVKPGTFEAVADRPEQPEATTVPLQLQPPRVQLVDQQPKPMEGVDLEQADVVVAVGRGLKQKEDLPLVEQLAELLGGQLGCTRSLCSDFGWLAEERMIGISGKTCKPRLHVSVGVSGQIQHAVGIQQSKTIVAINQDKAAPIFSMADYGVVGDLYQVVPRLVERLRNRAQT